MDYLGSFEPGIFFEFCQIVDLSCIFVDLLLLLDCNACCRRATCKLHERQVEQPAVDTTTKLVDAVEDQHVVQASVTS